MLYYLYHNDYSHNLVDPPDITEALLHVRVYLIADKHFIRHLRETAAKKLAAAVGTSWKTDAFTEAVAEVYAFTNGMDRDKDFAHKLRTIVLNVARQKAATLFAPGEKDSKFQEMARSAPEFALDIAKALVSQTWPPQYQLEPRYRRYRCPRCTVTFYAAINDNDSYEHSCLMAHVLPGKSSHYRGSAWRLYSY